MGSIKASDAARIVQCPGSWQLAQQYPMPQSDEASEGTAAHWVASEMLRGVAHSEGELAPNGVAVTEEMIDGAVLYMQEVESHLYGNHRPRGIEEGYKVPSIHPDNVAIPDSWFWNIPDNNTVYIFEYKFGHRFVPAFENWTLINYAAAIRDHITPQNGIESVNYELVVIQPRCFQAREPVRRWRISSADIAPYWFRLRDAYACATGGDSITDPPLLTGDQCRFCPASRQCSTLQSASLDIATWVDSFRTYDMDGKQVGDELTLLERFDTILSARIEGLKTQAEMMLKSGQQVSGWQIVPSYGREKWIGDPKAIIAMAEMAQVDVTKPALITPKQAIKAGLPAEVVKLFTETPVGTKLVKSTNLKEVFKNG